MDRDEDVLEALEACSVATPRDVQLWRSAPAALIDTVRHELGDDKFAPLEEKMTVEAVQRWGAKAASFVESMPWLETWASGV